MTQSPPPPQPTSAPHLALGKLGEEIAAEYLKRIGYTVRGTNVRISRDEIDVIAFDPKDNVIVFVEVKTRTRQIGGGYQPEATASQKKRGNLRRSARRWVTMHGYRGGYRMDLVCVTNGRVRHHFKELSWGRY